MMRKRLLLAAALLLSLGLSAQTFEKNSVAPEGNVLQRASGFVAQAPAASSSLKTSPKHVTLGPNQLLLGGYTSDNYAASGEGLGLSSFPGTLRAAIDLTASDFAAFNGGKVVKIRVALANSAEVTRVFITPVSTSGIGADLVSQDVSFNAVGWNEVELAKPVELDLSGYTDLLLGFDYTQTSTQTNGSYPLSMVSEGAKAYNSLVYGNLGQGIGWYNLGSSYGNLSVQAFVESDNFAEKDIVVGALSVDTYQKAGSNLNYSVDVQNFGTGTVENYAFDVLLDDVAVATLNGTEALGALGLTTLEGAVSLPADIAFGSHTVGVRLATVDGAAPAGDTTNDEASATFNIYKESVPRQKQLVEHFTSWTCTYCPRGYTLLRAIEEQYDDIAWVSIHGNQSSSADPLNFAACDELQDMQLLSGWPGASYNRTYIDDLAEGEETLIYGLGYNVAQYLSELVPYIYGYIQDAGAATPSFATLDIEQNYDADTRELQVTVKGDGVEGAAQLLADHGVTIYLTESGLQGRQYNEGTWVNVFDHNNALRAVLTPTVGEAPTWDGDNFTYTANYTVPADFVAENLTITALIAPIASISNPDIRHMQVNNTERVALDVTSTAISTVKTADNNTVVARYTLDGRRVSETQKGIVIEKMADGRTVKVVR